MVLHDLFYAKYKYYVSEYLLDILYQYTYINDNFYKTCDKDMKCKYRSKNRKEKKNFFCL